MKKIELKDSGLVLEPLTHTYHDASGNFYQGVTGTLIQRAFPNLYAGVSDEILEHAAHRGTVAHENIEKFLMGNAVENRFNAISLASKRLLSEKGINVHAVEYIVTRGKYASPIDVIGLTSKGEVCIIDIKTTSRFMYEPVQYQTSIYKDFFERQNPGLTVKALYCLWLLIDDDFNVAEAALKELTPLDTEVIDGLIDCDEHDRPFDASVYYGNLPAECNRIERRMFELKQTVDNASSEYEQLKTGLLSLMQQHNVKSFSNSSLSLTRVLSSVRKTVDPAKLKSKYPEVFADCIRESVSKESIRINFKM